MKLTKYLNNHLVSFGIAAGMLAGCGQGGAVSGGGGTPFSGTPITISSAAVIPTFNGAPTSTAIFVHNNTNQIISNISYNSGTSTSRSSFDKLAARFLDIFGVSYVGDTKISSTDVAINSTTAAACATIAAGASCQLGITTPAEVTSGTSMVSANYSFNNKAYNFNIPVSYSQQAKQVDGVYTTGGVQAFNYGNNVAYGTVYVYGGGTAQNYLIDSITSSNSGITFNQQTITVGQQLSSNQVAAIDLKAPLQTASGSLSISANVNITASKGGSNYSAQATMGALRTSGSYIAIPLIGAMDTAESTAATTAYAYNYGNVDATTVTWGSVTGLTKGSDTCSGTVTPGSFCQVTLTPTVAGSQGSGTLSATYGGGSSSSASQTVNWYNSKGAALLSIAVPSTITLQAAVTSPTQTVTISNPAGISGVPFTITTVSASNLTGTATITAGTNGCDGTTLTVGGAACTYQFTFSNSSVITNGQIKISVAGNYKDPTTGTTVNRTQLATVNYVTTGNQAVLTSNPANPTVSVMGDGTSVAYESVTITNSGTGTATATIGTVTLTNNSTVSSISNNGCASQVLANGASCVITLKLGPKVNNTSSAVTGNESFTIAYTSSGQTANSPFSTTVGYAINPESQTVVMTSAVTAGGSGSGTSGSPIVFNGNVLASGQTITLTYTNPGTVNLTVNGIDDHVNSSIVWSMTSNCNGVTLQANSANSCTVVYTNVLAGNANGYGGTIGATYARNLATPAVVLVDTVSSNLFDLYPNFPAANGGGTQLYVNNVQATVTNTATYSSPTLTVTQTIAASALSYPNYSLLMQTESYFTAASTTGNTVSGGSCSDSSSNTTNLWTVTCAVPTGVISGAFTRTYTYNTALGTNSQDMLFSLSGSNFNTAGGYVIGISPLYITQTAQ